MRVGDITENWIGEYLEWIGAGEQVPVPDDVALDEEASFASESLDERTLREAALLAALRAESDCVHVLRGIIDDPTPRPQAVKEACAALEHLADEVNAMASRVLATRIH
jgi:hypothetical protein